MWYSGLAVYALPSGKRVRFPALYAESKDGIHWEKPGLGICRYDGSTANNIMIHGGNLFGLFVNRDDPDASRRYKAASCGTNTCRSVRDASSTHSPDGIHWHGDLSRRLVPSLRGYTMPQGGIGDTTMFAGIAILAGILVTSSSSFRARCDAEASWRVTTSIHWSRPRMTVYPDGLDRSRFADLCPVELPATKVCGSVYSRSCIRSGRQGTSRRAWS